MKNTALNPNQQKEAEKVVETHFKKMMRSLVIENNALLRMTKLDQIQYQILQDQQNFFLSMSQSDDHNDILEGFRLLIANEKEYRKSLAPSKHWYDICPNSAPLKTLFDC